MTEQYHPEKQPKKLPQELNQELKRVFQLLPDFNIFKAAEGTYDVNPSGHLIDTRSPEEWKKDMDSLEAHLKGRKRSEIRPMLRARLHELLDQSHLTPSARTYAEWEFDELTVEGVEREDLPPELPFATELQYYTCLFQWNDAKNGGIFDPEQVRNIDRRLYKRAVEGILGRQRRERQFDEDKELQDSMRQAVEYGKEMKERIKRMSPEELEEYNREKAEEDAHAQETMQRWQKEEALVKVWREEYTDRYGDEP